VVSLQNHLISEISLLNPGLSPREVSDRIVVLIEKEILPKAIANITLPPLPSPIRIKREELVAPRYGKSVRVQKLVQARTQFMQDIEKLRSKFNGTDSANKDFFFGWRNDTQVPPSLEVKYEMEPSKEKLIVKPQIIHKPLDASTSLRVREKELIKPSRLINFDLSINEKIALDVIYERVIGALESNIRSNYSVKTLNIFFKFSIRIDTEDSDRQKTIIYIDIPDKNFREKMNLWRRIEGSIRDTIKKLDIPDAEKRLINRNLFTHIMST